MIINFEINLINWFGLFFCSEDLAHYINTIFTINLISKYKYRIRRCPIPPVSLGKSWSLIISLKKIILKNLELEITSKKKIFLIFFSLCTILQSSSYFFLKKFLISLLFFKLSMKLARAIYSWSSSVKSDHLESIEFSSL